MSKFKASNIAFKYLTGLKGIEIGGASHNPFNLDTINVDRKDKKDPEDPHRVREIQICSEFMRVDVVAEGDDLPFENKSFDFVLSSHVVEHFYDPIRALLEWKRVARKFIFITVPDIRRTEDKGGKLTTLQELIKRHAGEIQDPDPGGDGHKSYFIYETFGELLRYLDFEIIDSLEIDDKVGNGFTYIIKL